MLCQQYCHITTNCLQNPYGGGEYGGYQQHGEMASYCCNWNPTSSNANTPSRATFVPTVTGHTIGRFGQSSTHFSGTKCKRIHNYVSKDTYNEHVTTPLSVITNLSAKGMAYAPLQDTSPSKNGLRSPQSEANYRFLRLPFLQSLTGSMSHFPCLSGTFSTRRGGLTQKHLVGMVQPRIWCRLSFVPKLLKCFRGNMWWIKYIILDYN